MTIAEWLNVTNYIKLTEGDDSHCTILASFSKGLKWGR